MPPITNVMLTKLTSKIIRPKAAILLAIFAFCGFANAQQVSMALLRPASVGGAVFHVNNGTSSEHSGIFQPSILGS